MDADAQVIRVSADPRVIVNEVIIAVARDIADLLRAGEAEMEAAAREPGLSQICVAAAVGAGQALALHAEAIEHKYLAPSEGAS